MIKYFCDFCKKEMQMVGARPEIEIDVTVTRRITHSNFKAEKIEHVCETCNKALLGALNVMGLEVVDNGPEA